MTKEMNIYFVLPSHNEDELSASEEMHQAFELCRQNQIIPEWISEANCLTRNFSKKDIVVFEKFEGETFQQVQTRLVVGPWCIITCLLEGLQVPNNKSPIYNLAMYKLTVTASNYTPEEKLKIKDKVEMMGGVFNLNITSNVTHVISNSVRTQKYMVANTKGIPVMLDTWIENVWRCSLTRNVKATDEEFKRHKCPCFQNLRTCSTGLEVSERNKIQKLITENGGLYSGKLGTSSTDILVCKPGAKSEKYEVAKRAKIPCVCMEWVHDSLEKGYALPDDEYQIQVAVSTPTKSKIPLNPDFSMMSVIAGNENNDPYKTFVSETLNVSLLNVATPQSHRTVQKENQEPDVIAEIDLQVVRKAGTFLDGCGVLLAGFSPERREKLCRVLKSAGATRYDALSDRVTQVLVGDSTSHEVRILGSCAPLVSPAWLMESIRLGHPAPEEPFIVQTGAQTGSIPTPSSPLSKKGLTLLQNDISITACVSLKLPEPQPEEDECVKIYTNKINTEEDTLAQLLVQGNVNSKFEEKSVRPEPVTETCFTEQEETWIAIFEGKTCKIIDHSEEDTEKLTGVIEELDGKVVGNNYRGVTDYAVVPPISGIMPHAAAEVVSSLWIFECHEKNKLLTPHYYHQPLNIAANAQPLENCVITISGYAHIERTFLIHLIKALGATYQDKFARYTLEDRSVQASTHLVCLNPTGSKWMAAKRWNRPTVTYAWLLKCADTGQKVSEEQFLTGNEQNVARSPQYNKRDFEGNRISTPVPSTSKIEIMKVSPAVELTALVTPSITNKKKCDDKKISHVTLPVIPSPADTITTESKQSTSVMAPPVHNTNTPEAINKFTDQKPGRNPIINLDDGRVMSLESYMEELRADGIFETPSPLPKATSGTPVQEVLSRLRREGKLRSCQNNETPPRSGKHGGASQSTPVGNYLRGLQERNVLPSSPKQGECAVVTDSPLPRPFFDVKTPETPLGRFLGEDNPSPSTRKHWQRCLDNITHYNVHERPAAPTRRPSTPWSEIKRRTWAWLHRDENANTSTDGADILQSPAVEPEPSLSEAIAIPELVTESQSEVSNQISQLQDMLRRYDSSGPSRSILLTFSEPLVSINGGKESQADTVGWDEPLEDCVFSETTGLVSGPRKFMLSSVPDRTNICNIIRSLGGEVSDLNFFDATATHVVLSTPSRNEKILSSMAAGLWVLHHSYIEQSGAAGRFLSEEDYELGNPKSECNITAFIKSSPIAEAVHWWREKLRQSGKGAFHGMRALTFAKNTESVVRLIEAGGGTIVQARPPFAHNIDVTHCFIDTKIIQNFSEFIPLAEQGVPCLNIIFLSNFLVHHTDDKMKDFIIPSLQNYYS